MTRLSSYLLILTLVATGTLPGQNPAPRLVASTAANDPALDAAIAQLQSFLAKYPNSALRPNALVQLGELLVRKADADFADAQRTASPGGPPRGDAPERPEYTAAIARYEELLRRYPDHPQADAAAYTLGTLYYATNRYTDAVRTFDRVSRMEQSPFRAEAFFRLGDSYFELASRQRGDARRATFARAASAYESATNIAANTGDIYFLSLYKLGWSFYSQATRKNQDEYRKAVDIFGRLVAEYDRLTPAQQSRLGLRGEAIEYMAVAFTQVGGAEAANQYFSGDRANAPFRLPLLRRVAASLRDQGDFIRAVEAYRAVIAQAPTDSGALSASREIIDILRNRMLEQEEAQLARLELIRDFAPGSPWAIANPGLSREATETRETALRESAQYSLALAQQRSDKQRYAEAAELYGQYLREFASSDSVQAMIVLYGESLFGQGEYSRAGLEYSRAAYGTRGNPKTSQQAGQNAIVAFDSALVRNRTDRATQDSLFATVDRFVAAFPESDIARKALLTKGRRASETSRWDVMASTFRSYAERYPNDAFTTSAQKLVGDALYRQGMYAEAQQQWDVALTAARRINRRALADSIVRLRTAAAASFADTLVRTGEYRRAAEEVYVAFADKNPASERAADALRNAVESYLLADSVARARNDPAASQAARERAIELATRLVTQYPRYRYRTQYQSLRAQLLADVGRRDEAVDALRIVIRENPSWAGRADAMVRLAVVLDSLGRKPEAAAAYEQFSAAFPRDARAADAQYNAAVTYRDAGDAQKAARAFAAFASRYPRDSRAPGAQQAQVAMLRTSGDTASASRELARICARPTDALRATCAERVAESAFRQGQALFPQYQAVRLVIPRASQLTLAGVERASVRKRQLLSTMTGHFRRAIQTGNPEWLAAASYYAGLAQWEYGNFLKNVSLPSDLTDAQAATARQGAEQQAQQYYDAARKAWRELLQKAEEDRISSVWITRAREALAGNVPATPPTASRDSHSTRVVGGEG